MMRTLLIIILILLLQGCFSALEDSSQTFAESPDARKANEYMWNKLHLGEYDSIPEILARLQESHENDPDDPKVTAHLGFVHLWAFSERIRKAPDKEITRHVYLSNRYFKKAIELNPEDARMYGFQAGIEMCQGALDKDLIMISGAYTKAVRAVNKWPQFNKFALSYVESLQPRNSPLFKQGVQFQWELLDDCSCDKLTKKEILKNPEKVLASLVKEMESSTDEEIRRACWNTWVAPHNLEGFFLNMGDMLVKNGEIENAKVIYAAARLAPSYPEWPYKHLVDERIRNAEANYINFNKQMELVEITNPDQIFINSAISCVGCHQMSPAEFKRYGYQEPRAESYSITR